MFGIGTKLLLIIQIAGSLLLFMTIRKAKCGPQKAANRCLPSIDHFSSHRIRFKSPERHSPFAIRCMS